MSDVLDRIDETLTYYSAGLGEEIGVPRETPDGLATIRALDEHYEAALRVLVGAVQQIFDTYGPVTSKVAALNRQFQASTPKRQRRTRRAALRRVHRDYVRRRRNRDHGVWIDETRWWAPEGAA